MKNLQKFAMAAVMATVSLTGKHENINESILRILGIGGEKLTRHELRARITLDRLKVEHGEEALQEMTEKDFLEIFEPMSKTVKNGIDTSISRSNNNSSFHYNEKYKGWKLEETGGVYQLISKVSK